VAAKLNYLGKNGLCLKHFLFLVHMEPNHTKGNQFAGKVAFDNTEIAFRHYTDTDLTRAYWLFRLIDISLLVKIGQPLIRLAVKVGLPIKGMIKATLFRHFCGGETIDECHNTIERLASGGVGTILDYSVESADEGTAFDATRDEIIRTIVRASADKHISLTVFKITGLARFDLLEKLDANSTLTASEEQEWKKVKDRINTICQKAYNANVSVMIDAEETWIQHTIDEQALTMMRLYNRQKAIVYNTYQLYRKDKLSSLQHDFNMATQEGFILGVKLVRGAYMEKERQRAAKRNYPSPIQADKVHTDRDYNAALQFCVQHHGRIAFVAGTHNEESCRLLISLLHEYHIAPNHPHNRFAQLLGMSDNLSFNLADAGYRVAKYVPYGPVNAVLPYLFRRAQENTAISGQMGRELQLVIKERKRRKLN
jgi:proline dehydrogenase